jgi:hypothetical protein
MADPSPHYYQAIATIQGELILDDPHPVIVVGDSTVRRKHQPGQVQDFRVYPRLRHKWQGSSGS